MQIIVRLGEMCGKKKYSLQSSVVDACPFWTGSRLICVNSLHLLVDTI
jgi:hypothetical protein